MRDNDALKFGQRLQQTRDAARSEAQSIAEANRLISEAKNTSAGVSQAERFGVQTINQPVPIYSEYDEGRNRGVAMGGQNVGLYGSVPGTAELNRRIRRGGNEGLLQSSRAHLTHDQLADYNYLRGAGYADLAESYMENAMREAETKAAASMAEELKDKGALTTTAYSFGTGLVADTGRGMRQAIGRVTNPDDYLSDNAYQQALSMAREDFGTGQRIAGDVARGVGAMLPSVAVGVATGGASTAGTLGKVAAKAAPTLAMAMPIFGREYSAAIAEGKNKDEATLYAGITAGLEGGLQYALGGIRGIGSSTGITRTLGNVLRRHGDDIATAARTASGARGFALDMADEAFEEYLQSAINPIVRNVVYREQNKLEPLSEENLYAALIGGLTAGAMNAPSYVARGRSTPQTTETEEAVRMMEDAVAEDTAETERYFEIFGDDYVDQLQNRYSRNRQDTPDADAIPASLYNMREGENGWGASYDTALEAIGNALVRTDRELWEAVEAVVDSSADEVSPTLEAIAPGLYAVQVAVQNGEISPMQAANSLSEAYKSGGLVALGSVVAPTQTSPAQSQTSPAQGRVAEEDLRNPFEFFDAGYLEKLREKYSIHRPEPQPVSQEIGGEVEQEWRSPFELLGDDYIEQLKGEYIPQQPATPAQPVAQPSTTSVPPVSPASAGRKMERKTVQSIERAAEMGIPGMENVARNITEEERFYQQESMDETQDKAMRWITDKGGMDSAVDLLLSQKRPLTMEEFEAGTVAIQRLGEADDPRLPALRTKLLTSATDFGRAINLLKILTRNTRDEFIRLSEAIANEAEITMDKPMQDDIAVLGEIAEAGAITEAALEKLTPSTREWVEKAVKYIDKGYMDVEETAIHGVSKLLSEKMQPTARDRFQALQRLSMLSNFRSHIRNITGNIAQTATNLLARPFAAAADKIISRYTGSSTYGGTSAATYLEGAREGLDRVTMSRELGIDAVPQKYDDIERSVITARPRHMFPDSNPIGKFMNSALDIISTGLSYGDAPFFYAQKAIVEEQMRNANKDKLAKGEITEEEISAAAWQAAERATFQDDNAVTSRLSDIRRSAGFIGDTIAPYVRTPANVVKTAIELSPVGFVEALVKSMYGNNSLRALKANGENTLSLQRDIAELFGKGAVGTGALLLGMLLKQVGAVSDDRDDRRRVSSWESAQGITPNSIRVGDTYIDVSSLQSLSVPIMAGAAAATGEEFTPAEILQAMVNVGNTALEMPVLQGVQDLFGGTYSDESLIYGILALAADAVQQTIPFASLIRQISRTTDPYARSTYSSDTEGVEHIGEELANEITSIIPGRRENLPIKYDVLGNPIQNNAGRTPASRAFNNFLNPFNTSRAYETDLTRELNRLYETTQSTSVLPKVAPTDIGYGGVSYDMSQEEIQRYQQIAGSTASEILDALFASEEYKQASEESKADMVMSVIDYSGDAAKLDFLAGKNVEYTSGDWRDDIRTLDESGFDEAEAILYRELLSLMEEEGDTVMDRRLFINSLELSEEQKKALDNAFMHDVGADYSSEEALYLSVMTDAARRRWDAVRSLGFTAPEYYELYSIKNSASRKAEQIQALQNAGLSYDMAVAFWNASSKD